jgi:hypothetical protein
VKLGDVMDTVFTAFVTSPYTFIQTEAVNGGYESVTEYQANGVIKHRDGKLLNGRQESYDTQTTLHIRPSEPFISPVNSAKALVGNFVRIDSDEYRINACTTGTNFDTGVVEHYRATLEQDNLFVSELPLE